MLKDLAANYWPVLLGAIAGGIISSIVCFVTERSSDWIIFTGLGLDVGGILIAGIPVLERGWVRPGLGNMAGPILASTPRDALVGRIGIGVLISGFTTQAFGQLS